LAQRERSGHRCLGLGERAREGVRGLVAELRLGEAELLLGGLQLVVDRHEGAAGALVELGRGELCELVVRARARAAGRATAPARQPGDDEHHEDEDEAADEQPRADAPGGAPTGLGAENVDRSGDRTGPVVLPQPVLDRGGEVVVLSVGDRRVEGDREPVLALVDGDGEERVLGAHPGEPVGLLRPVHRVHPVELVDEHDEELHVRLVAQPVELRLDRGRVVTEDPRLVGDVRRHVQRVRRARRRQGEGAPGSEQDRDEHRADRVADRHAPTTGRTGQR
jgi:hypothetical protein